MWYYDDVDGSLVTLVAHQWVYGLEAQIKFNGGFIWEHGSMKVFTMIGLWRKCSPNTFRAKVPTWLNKFMNEQFNPLKQILYHQHLIQNNTRENIYFF